MNLWAAGLMLACIPLLIASTQSFRKHGRTGTARPLFAASALLGSIAATWQILDIVHAPTTSPLAGALIVAYIAAPATAITSYLLLLRSDRRQNAEIAARLNAVTQARRDGENGTANGLLAVTVAEFGATLVERIRLRQLGTALNTDLHLIRTFGEAAER